MVVAPVSASASGFGLKCLSDGQGAVRRAILYADRSCSTYYSSMENGLPAFVVSADATEHFKAFG